ncbi:MAG: electron transport complex subunit RsxC [Spirochaetaceae bacterium 4572_59]|nr:MAG: electron transport complex subunit RsxC [Spirochaetaceae bacterium 4572_59]
MKRLNTFPKGGIHPRDCKEASCDKVIQNASMSNTAVVPLSQHIGAPAECLVKKGDIVEEGQLLGKSGGFVSANIHSPVPGEVKEIKNIFLPNGISTPAVVIEMQGEFSRLGKAVPSIPWEGMSVEELTAKVSEMGIVGQGGATFPTHVKLAIPKGKTCEIFIINAVECEPYLTSDHRVMMEKGREVLEGIRIIQKILSPSRTVIGIEANKMDAVEHLDTLIKQSGLNMEVMPLQVKYPQGAEKNLIKAVTGKEVPSGKLPLELGVINANVGTCLSIYEAVVEDKPVIERVVTVSGGAIKNPSNLKARIGTSFRTLIEDCGGFSEEPAKIVAGGPMMGFTVYDLDTPVTKGTSGILALTDKEIKAARQTACLSCGRCLSSCPMGVNPTKIFKLIDNNMIDEAAEAGLMDCVECGSCAFMCPAHIPLVQGFRTGKKILRKNAMKKAGK